MLQSWQLVISKSANQPVYSSSVYGLRAVLPETHSKAAINFSSFCLIGIVCQLQLVIKCNQMLDTTIERQMFFDLFLNLNFEQLKCSSFKKSFQETSNVSAAAVILPLGRFDNQIFTSSSGNHPRRLLCAFLVACTAECQSPAIRRGFKWFK